MLQKPEINADQTGAPWLVCRRYLSGLCVLEGVRNSPVVFHPVLPLNYKARVDLYWLAIQLRNDETLAVVSANPREISGEIRAAQVGH